MELSYGLVLIAVAIGMVQLVAGIIIGRVVPLRKPGPTSLDAWSLHNMTRQIFGVVDTVAGDVGEHQARLEDASRELTQPSTEQNPAQGGSILKTVSRVLKVNQELKSRLVQAERKLENQAERLQSHIMAALTDPLTNLPNRRAFDEEIARRLSQWQRRGTSFCLLLFDVDHFKSINDRFGHSVGDDVLRHLAIVLRCSLHEGDLMARIGGEEFAAILSGASLAGGMAAARRVLGAVSVAPFDHGMNVLHITVSAGLAVITQGEDVSHLLKRADKALYASKHGGRNCAHLHDGSTCVRIEPETPKDHNSALDSGAVQPEGLQEACLGLQARLNEVLKTDAPPDSAAARP
jgi:diguanylate cyclase